MNPMHDGYFTPNWLSLVMHFAEIHTTIRHETTRLYTSASILVNILEKRKMFNVHKPNPNKKKRE